MGTPGGGHFEGTGPEVRPRKACRRKRRRSVGLEGRNKEGAVSQRGVGVP